MQSLKMKWRRMKRMSLKMNKIVTIEKFFNLTDHCLLKLSAEIVCCNQSISLPLFRSSSLARRHCINPLGIAAVALIHESLLLFRLLLLLFHCSLSSLLLLLLFRWSVAGAGVCCFAAIDLKLYCRCRCCCRRRWSIDLINQSIRGINGSVSPLLVLTNSLMSLRERSNYFYW